MSSYRKLQIPKIEPRRQSDFLHEFLRIAKSWIPEWELDESHPDFGMALLKIASRYNSEVAERLDRVGDKSRRGFLDWLAISGKAARATRVPVAFKLSESAKDSVLASSPIQLQVETDGSPVTLETGNDLRIIPGFVDTLVGVDSGNDKYYLPPPGLSNLEPSEPLPNEWRLRNAATGNILQLEPDAGLSKGQILRVENNSQHLVERVENGIAEISPPVEKTLERGTVVRNVSSFSPFEKFWNQQRHHLYLSHSNLFNLETAGTTIDIVVNGSSQDRSKNKIEIRKFLLGLDWEYWGETEDGNGWIKLGEVGSTDPGDQSERTGKDEYQEGTIRLVKKENGNILPLEIDGVTNYWIRATEKKEKSKDKESNTSEKHKLYLQANHVRVRINFTPESDRDNQAKKDSRSIRSVEAMANTTPLVLDQLCYPLGKEPRQFDTFYLGCEEAFSKQGSKASVDFTFAEQNFRNLTPLLSADPKRHLLAGISKGKNLYIVKFDSEKSEFLPYQNGGPLAPIGKFGKLNSEVSTPIWETNDSYFIAVAEGKRIFVRREFKNDPLKSHWIDLKKEFENHVKSIVHVTESGLHYLFVLAGAEVLGVELSEEGIDLTSEGNPKKWNPTFPDTKVSIHQISSVLLQESFLQPGSLQSGFVAIGLEKEETNTPQGGNARSASSVEKDESFGELYKGSISDATNLEFSLTKFETDDGDHITCDSTVSPRSVRDSTDQTTIALGKKEEKEVPTNNGEPEKTQLQKIVAIKNGEVSEVELKTMSLITIDPPKVIGKEFAVRTISGNATFGLILDDQKQFELGVWSPFSDTDVLVRVSMSSKFGSIEAAPTFLNHSVIIPNTTGELIVSKFNPSPDGQRDGIHKTAVSSQNLKNGELIFAIKDEEVIKLHQIIKKFKIRDAIYCELDSIVSSGNSLFHYTSIKPFPVEKHDNDRSIKIDSEVVEFGDKQQILVSTDNTTQWIEIESFNSSTRIATLETDLNYKLSTEGFFSVASLEAKWLSGDDPKEIRLDANDRTTKVGTPLLIKDGDESKTFVVRELNGDKAKLSSDLSNPTDGSYSYLPGLSATAISKNQIKLASHQLSNCKYGSLLISTSKGTKSYPLKEDDSDAGTVKLDEELDVKDGDDFPLDVYYYHPLVMESKKLEDVTLKSLVRKAVSSEKRWDANELERLPVIFEGFRKRHQAEYVHRVTDEVADFFVLNSTIEVPASVKFQIESIIDPFESRLKDSSLSPELSWEYWNGNSWSNLRPEDRTLNFKTSGKVLFDIPNDLEASEWAGKTNYWIRARLIGGDYGREKVTIKVEEVDKKERQNNKETTQTVERSNEGIKPPSLLSVKIDYHTELTAGSFPEHLVTLDSGSFRNQSEANVSPGTLVEAFLPIDVFLSRLSGDENNGADKSRCLFLGLTKNPGIGSLNVYFKVREKNRILSSENPNTREHKTANRIGKLNVEAVVGGRFVDLYTEDETNSLSESGIISILLVPALSKSELFGVQRYWLKLTPNSLTKNQSSDKDAGNIADHKAKSTEDPSGDTAKTEPEPWNPEIEGVYLNAVWTEAKESLTRELLGSSDGRPDLTIQLARPPVLQGSLELRVREPLGQDERESLKAEGENVVLSSVKNLPGDWVLWTQVTDPNDSPSNARVYELDEESGTIRFGNGRNGRIPPIGKDSIVAFQYERTESAKDNKLAAGNAIQPLVSMNLVSPVETVDNVVSVDQAGGGAPTESLDRVVKFSSSRLRNRNRVVSMADLEEITLQDFPSINQVKAFRAGNSVKLIAVGTGNDPIPKAATLRAIKHHLQKICPISLLAQNILQVFGPEIFIVKIVVKLQLTSIEHSGRVAIDVRNRIRDFFDLETGGLNRSGWKIGQFLGENELAYVLKGMEDIESILEVKLEKPQESIPPYGLLQFVNNSLQVEFQTSETSS